MTPIDSLLKAKQCLQASERFELHKKFEDAVKKIDATIHHLNEWKKQIKIESEK